MDVEVKKSLPEKSEFEGFVGPLIEKGETGFKSIYEAVAWLHALKFRVEEKSATSLCIYNNENLIAHGGFFLNGNEEGEIFIAVSEEHRNKGLGRTLLSYIEKEAQSRGVARLYGVIGQHGSSGKFFEKLGYSVVAQKAIKIFSEGNGIALKTFSKNKEVKLSYKVVPMVENMTDDIDKLQERKKELIDKVKAATKRLKYKKIELEAVNKLLEEYNEEEVQRIQRALKGLEFKIQTKALTAKAEKEMVKRIVSLEKKLAKWRPMIKAKRRKKYIEQDIEELTKEIEEIEGELKDIRARIKELLQKKRMKEHAKKKNLSIAEEVDEMVSMTDVVVIEEKKK